MTTLLLITTACACVRDGSKDPANPYNHHDSACDQCEGSGRIAAEVAEVVDTPDTREHVLRAQIVRWLDAQGKATAQHVVRRAKAMAETRDARDLLPRLDARKSLLSIAASRILMDWLACWFEETCDGVMPELGVALPKVISWVCGEAVIAAPETPEQVALPAPSAGVEPISETPEGTPTVALAEDDEPVMARVLGICGHIAAAAALERERTSPEARQRQADEAVEILIAGNARVRREAAEATLLDAVQGKWPGSAADLHASAGRARALGVDPDLVKRAHRTADLLAVQEKLSRGELRLEPRQQPVRRMGACVTLGDLFTLA